MSREATAARPEVAEFLTYLDKQRGQSPNTVKAYGRDLEAFTGFCDRHYGGSWTWTTVDRLGMRGFLGELQRRGLSKRSAARALSAVRSLYRFLQENHGVVNNIARAAKVPKLDKRLPTYMGREQTEALFDWAATEHGVHRFVASVSPTNTPSLQLIAGFGFERTGEHMDEIDGLEYEFEADWPRP